MIFKLGNSINQQITVPDTKEVELFIKREDEIHPFVSGNKYRKLKYNLLEAKKKGLKHFLLLEAPFQII